jgi:hypothetical protein
MTCAFLLLRNFGRTRARLLLWCGCFFAALAMENIVLFVDLILYSDTDLSGVRTSIALTGCVVLLFGLVWDSK